MTPPLWPEMQPTGRVKNDGYQLLKMKNESSNHRLARSSPRLEALWLKLGFYTLERTGNQLDLGSEIVIIPTIM